MESDPIDSIDLWSLTPLIFMESDPIDFQGRGGYKNGMRENPHVDVHRMRDGVSVEAEKRKYPLGDHLYEKE